MKNKAKAIAIIKKDCILQHRYFYKGQTCAVGALALAAGVSKRSLVQAGKVSIRWRHSIVDKVESVFGLDIFQLQNIQDTNDDYLSLSERRREIVGYLKSL